MSITYTPEPWWIDADGLTVKGSHGLVVAKLTGTGFPEGDALLIPAAPDLLNALIGLGQGRGEDLCFCTPTWRVDSHTDACIAANTAIAKAYGWHGGSAL